MQPLPATAALVRTETLVPALETIELPTLEGARRTEATAKTYASALRRMLGEVTGREVEPGGEVEAVARLVGSVARPERVDGGRREFEGVLQAWIDSNVEERVSRPLSPESIRKAVRAIRAALRELERSCGLPWSLDALELRQPVAEGVLDRSGPGIEAVRALLDAMGEAGTLGAKRDRVLVLLACAAGLRNAEIRNLTVADVRVERDSVTLRIRAKGGRGQKTRHAVTGALVEPIRDWIAALEDGCNVQRIELVGTAAFLPRVDRWGNIGTDKQGAPAGVSAQAVSAMLARWSKVAGVSLVRCHGLRHTGATETAKATNGDPIALKAWGRWKSETSLWHYIDTKEEAALNAQDGIADRLL